MKSKLVKIWGVVLALSLLVSLLVGAVPAAAGTLAYTPVGSPNSGKNQLSPGSDCSVLEIAPDGLTMFIYDNVTGGGTLFKSTDGGVTFSSANIGTTLNANAVSAMAISPNYATDSTVVACGLTGAAAKVWRSINGGKSWGEVGTNVGGFINAASTMTSVDVSDYYSGGQAIVAGDGDITTLTSKGGVSLFTTTSLIWADLTGVAGGLLKNWPAEADVLAVSFSPNHLADAAILAVAADPTDTYVRTLMGTENWSATVVDAKLALGQPTYATIAFPADYEWSSNNKLFVGTANDLADATKFEDAYSVSLGLAAGSSKFTDLNVNGGGANDQCNVRSIAVKGNFVGGKVLVGQWASLTVKRTADASASTVSWSSSTKSPTGGVAAGNYVIAAWSPTSDTAYAASVGTTATTTSAFSKSVDGGITWNPVAMIDVSANANLAILDFVAADVNNMFLIMYDDADASTTITANDYTMLFKSTNGGVNWENVWWFRTTAAGERMQFVNVSPAYATDSTVFVAQNDTRIWKSTSGGQSWMGMTSPAAITAFKAIDGSTYYTGAAAGFYKSGRWTSPVLPAAVASIVIAPSGTIYVGLANGSVQKSTDDGKNFSAVGAASEMGAANSVYLTIDPDGKTLYAGAGVGTTASAGLYRWVDGTSTVWEKIDSGITTTTTGTAGADAFKAVFAGTGATNVLTLVETSGKVLITVDTTSTGAVPTIAYNGTNTWTVTPNAATNVVRVTATGTVAPCNGTLAMAGGGAGATFAIVVDANANAGVTAAIAAGAGGSFYLPDLSGTTTTTSGALLATGAVCTPDGTLYAANNSANSGIRRSVSPTLDTAAKRNFESILQDLPTGAQFVNLKTTSAATGNTLYGVVSGVAAGSYGYTTRVVSFEDILAIVPTLSAPKDKTVTGGTSVTLSWAAITSPVSLTYRVQTATDVDFANKKDDTTTTGTSITFTGFTPGTTYWYRVYVDTGSPLSSKKSAKWTFIPELAAPVLESPEYGYDVTIQRPTFSWQRIAGADSYELEMSTNPFFAAASVKKPLTHTTWTWDEDLEFGTTYYWRVRGVKAPNVFSPWSESVFTIKAAPVPTPKPVEVTIPQPTPAPVINLPAPVVNIPPAPAPTPSPITPTVIWAIIIIGAILVVAVIVLIVRTRRVP